MHQMHMVNLVISCHFFGFLNIRPLTEFSRLGVYVFFFISGYLYGNRRIENKKNWICKRILRLFIPLYLYLIFYYLRGNEIVLHNLLLQLINLQGLNYIFTNLPAVPGPWFLTVIMFCYLFLILINKYLCSLLNNKKYNYKRVIFISIIIYLLFKAINIDIIGVLVFFIGYMYKIEDNNNYDLKNLVKSSLLLISVFSIRIIAKQLFDSIYIYISRKYCYDYFYSTIFQYFKELFFNF